MLVNWDDVEFVEMAPGIRHKQVEMGNVFVSYQEFDDPGLGREMRVHSHPHQQAGYILEGALEVLVGDEILTIQAGDAYMIPPGLDHGGRAQVPCRLLNFYVAPDAEHIEEYRGRNTPLKGAPR
jgi:mannose-6-phosphate isomerase-like protein (cupin superfamily)